VDWDLFEILPAVEDVFGLAVPDDDVDRLNTVGKLYHYVLAHRLSRDQEPDACLITIAFRKIQRTLMTILRLPREEVQESTQLSSIISGHRRKTWRAIEKETGFHLPILRRPRRVVMTATLAAIGLGVWIPLSLGLKPLQGANVVAIISMAGFGYLFYRLTAPVAHEFPPDLDTVGDLVKATLARNYQPILAEAKRTATDADVWDTLRHIIAVQMGFPPSEITGDMEFSRHLIVC
jgi:hypothetical protein